MIRLPLFFWILWWACLAVVARTSDWASDAVWYQIFPERFRNGDPGNDPTAASLDGTWPFETPPGWRVSPWTSDWYALQPWEAANGKGFYHNAQLRRYGGDLQGILDKLDHLQNLGVTAIYLNPVFESPSLHKYGATLFHHIDKHFGPDPVGDLRMFAMEDAGDAATWKWTAADRLFLKLIEEVHRRDMRIIIDGVFNHCGTLFWALQKARKEGPGSRYANWFHITQWDDPATAADEFAYRGWSGVRDLPEFNRDAHNLHPEIREHFRAVVRRWMDPNGDGDPSDGVDGWRVDVAAEVPIGFWEEFRGWVKGLRPDAYITGEIWWEDFQANRFRDARPWLDRAFDGVMNYRFGDLMFEYLNRPGGMKPGKMAELWTEQHRSYGYERCLALQNIHGSHDTARIGSAVVNPSLRQDHGASVAEHPAYNTRAPNTREKRRWKQMIAFQFLAPGAPYIYYGDEVGMWGADDPDCRKPMVWPDQHHESEQMLPTGLRKTRDPVRIDRDLQSFYRTWATRRRSSAVLRQGDFQIVHVDDATGVLGFQRRLGGESVVGIFNSSDDAVVVALSSLKLEAPMADWKRFAGAKPSGGKIRIGPHGFAVLECKR